MFHHLRAGAALLGVVVIGFMASPVRATFHEWRISEIYSNGSGTNQFIEFVQPGSVFDDEQFVGGISVTDSSFGNTFTIPANLPAVPTANSNFLIGTAGFAALSGAPKPDYIMPADFFNPAGDTLTYASGIDTLTFAGNQLPTDGIHSLNRLTYAAATLNSEVNSPTNFSGQTGSVPEPAAAGVLLIAALALLSRAAGRREGVACAAVRA